LENDTIIYTEGMAGIDVSPIVCNGFVYTVTSEGKLFKYYLNGTQVTDGWPISFNESPIGTYDYMENGGLAAGNGYIYLVDGYNRSTDNDLYAINEITGINYSVPVNNSAEVQFSTPVTYIEGCNGSKYVLFGSVRVNGTTYANEDGMYYCYNVTGPTNPTECWNYSSLSGYYWAGAAAIGHYAVFGNDAGGLVSIDCCTCAVADEVDASDVYGFDVGAIESSVSYSNETAIFDNETGRIYFTSFN
jgi:hypothetical protein